MNIDALIEMLKGYERRTIHEATLGKDLAEREKTIHALKKLGWKVAEYPPMSGLYDITKVRL